VNPRRLSFRAPELVPHAPARIRRMRLGRALAEALCVVCGFAGFAFVVVFAL